MSAPSPQTPTRAEAEADPKAASLAASACPYSAARMSVLSEYIRSHIIGSSVSLDGPFGRRPLLYCDWVASGRALSFIEQYLQRCVLPLYANTHSVSSATGLQTSLFRKEARDLIGRECGASKDDVVLFAGSGSTGAFQLLLSVMTAGWRQTGVECRTDVCVYVGPYQHHSVLLPLREMGCTLVHIREDAAAGGVDLPHLTAALTQHSARYRVNVGCFSAASNVSGLLTDSAAVSAVCNEFGCVNVWDYATAAPYVDVDMHPQRVARFDKQAIILSPHKMLGGVSTPGVLIVSKRLLTNSVPSVPGGGTVFFVSPDGHRYLQNFEEREEAGTPNIVASIRAGLAFQLKGSIDSEWRTARLQRYTAMVMERLRGEDNIVLMGNATAPRLPIFSFLVRHAGSGLYLHPSFVSALLNDLFGIQSRSGCMCAGPYGHRLLGVSAAAGRQVEQALVRGLEILKPGYTRLNAHWLLEEHDVTFVCDCLSFIARDGWRLLPLYGFYTDSGEWRHRERLHERVGRLWLGDIDYSSGTMQYSCDDDSSSSDSEQSKQREGEAPTGSVAISSLADMLAAARQLAATAAGFVSSAALADESAALPADVQHLRWFMLPSEAAAAIRSSQQQQNTAAAPPHRVVINSATGPQLYSDGPRSVREEQPMEQPVEQSVKWDKKKPRVMAMHIHIHKGTDDEQQRQGVERRGKALGAKKPSGLRQLLLSCHSSSRGRTTRATDANAAGTVK